MKTLKNSTLIYDEKCPLCKMYTGLFVYSEFLDKNGRIPYHQINTLALDNLDTNKARNEIALVNKETGTITYGVESLITILGNQWPVLKKAYKIRFIKVPLNKLYFFISFNRKVISPSKTSKDDCIPDFSLKYRIAYLIFAWLIVSFLLYHFSLTISPLVPASSPFSEIMIAGGQILFQSIFLFLLKTEKKMDYLGNMMTVSFFGGLLLLPAIIAHWFIELPQIYLSYFALVVLWMVWEHSRRVSILSLSGTLTLTWVMYRIIVLLYILYL